MVRLILFVCSVNVSSSCLCLLCMYICLFVYCVVYVVAVCLYVCLLLCVVCVFVSVTTVFLSFFNRWVAVTNFQHSDLLLDVTDHRKFLWAFSLFCSYWLRVINIPKMAPGEHSISWFVFGHLRFKFLYGRKQLMMLFSDRDWYHSESTTTRLLLRAATMPYWTNLFVDHCISLSMIGSPTRNTGASNLDCCIFISNLDCIFTVKDCLLTIGHGVRTINKRVFKPWHRTQDQHDQSPTPRPVSLSRWRTTSLNGVMIGFQTQCGLGGLGSVGYERDMADMGVS